MANKLPEKYSVEYLKKLRPYMTNAIKKLNGDTSNDSPETGLYKDDDTDPIDEVGIFLNRIVDALSTNLLDPKQQQAQLDLLKNYMVLKDTAQHYLQGFMLYQKLENGLKTIETNSLYHRDKTNLNDLVK